MASMNINKFGSNTSNLGSPIVLAYQSCSTNIPKEYKKGNKRNLESGAPELISSRAVTNENTIMEGLENKASHST